MTRANAGRGDGRSALPERQNKPTNTADGDGAVRDRQIWWTGQLEAPEEVTSQLSQEGMTKLIMVVVVVGGGVGGVVITRMIQAENGGESLV